MSFLATFALAVLAAAPQGEQPPATPAPQDPAPTAPAPQQPELLTPAEQQTMHKRLVDYIEAMKEYDDSSDKERERANKAYNKAKAAFTKEWEAKVEKARKGSDRDLLGSMPDLEALFTNCFVYKPMKVSTNQLNKLEVRGGKEDKKLDYSLFLPKAYKPENPTRTVVVIPGMRDDGSWMPGPDFFTQTWDKAPALADTVIHVVHVPAGMELDAMPKWGEETAELNENQRTEIALRSFGQTQQQVNVDRRRVFLDCGRGACAFALRLAANFPNRFAGLILRHPTAVDELRLGSLAGVPVLLLKSESTAAAADKLKQRLDEISKDACKTIQPADSYPFKGAQTDIEAWMAGVKRDLNRKTIVFEPNDDRFRKAWWLMVGKMDSIQGTPADQQPRMEITADRAANRITVKARGVDTFSLLLNDSLVDLDKEFTVVVNEKAITEKRARDFNRILNLVVREKFDADWLFPVQFDCMVPKVDKAQQQASQPAGK